MDVTAALLRFTARVPHVLIVGVPGHPDLHLDVEEAVRLRGWPEATGPADADVLVVAGRLGAELREVVDALWRQIPAPRVRVELADDATPADLENTLAAIPSRLADPQQARHEAAAAAAAASGVADDQAVDGAAHEHEHRGHDDGGHDHHGGTAAGEPDKGRDERRGGPAHDDELGEHADHDHQHSPDDSGIADAGEHGAHDERNGRHGEHHDENAGGHGGGHDHHHMNMPLPGGLSMADVADDRDGLTLDVLHVALGPVLPEWPAGLVVDVALQGDVITSATARVLDAGEPRPPRRARVSAAVRDLDALARVLAIAGWPGPATRARVLRDRLRRGEPVADLARLVRAIRRSKLLRLMLRGTPSGAGADVAELLEQRLVRIEARAAGAPVDDPVRPGLADLGTRLAGAEFAAARLLIAALDPDVEGVVAATATPCPGEEQR